MASDPAPGSLGYRDWEYWTDRINGLDFYVSTRYARVMNGGRMSTYHETVVNQIKNGCIHFNGFGFGEENARKCKAGIVIRALVGDDDFGWHKRAPCILTNDSTVICTCQKFPTPDEAEIIADADRAHLDHMMEALRRCVDDSEVRGFTIGGAYMSSKVTCPKCGSVFGYTRDGENGHVHGVCMKPDCNLEFTQ